MYLYYKNIFVIFASGFSFAVKYCKCYTGLLLMTYFFYHEHTLISGETGFFFVFFFFLFFFFNILCLRIGIDL